MDLLVVNKVSTVLKGWRGNFPGVCSCLLLLIGSGIQLNAAAELSAANASVTSPQSLHSLSMASATTPGTYPPNRGLVSASADPLSGVRYRYDLGPFFEMGKVEEVVRFLESHDVQAGFAEKKERQPLGYIVVSRRFESRAAAGNMMDTLAIKGIRDLTYMRAGDYAGRISMGAYSNEANARVREDVLQELGFDVEVIQRSRMISQWWIQLAGDIDEERLLADIDNLLGISQLALERQAEVIPDPVQEPVAETPEIVQEDISSAQTEEPVTVPAVPADTVAFENEVEISPPSPAETKEDVRVPGLPTAADVSRPGVEKYISGFEVWVVAGLLLLVAVMAIWYVLRRRAVRQKHAPSPLAALVSSTLNEHNQGMLVLDNDYNIVLANKAFCQLVGKNSEELKGERISTLGVSGEDSGSVETLWGSLSGQAAPRINIRVHLKLANSTYSTFLTSTSPLQTEDGVVSGTIVSFRPILELNDERGNIDLVDQADSYRWSGSEFLERIRPENQPPIHAILQYAELLQQRRALDPVEKQNYLDAISSDESRIVKLLGNILELSQHHSGSFSLEEITFSPVSLIEEILNSENQLATEKGCRLMAEGLEDLPGNVVADPGRLGRILKYLLLNAIQRTAHGDVILRAKSGTVNGSDELGFEIIDQSGSLTNVDSDDCYTYLEQLALANPDAPVGHELDLVITRQLVEELDGCISVEAGPDGNASFILSVPVETRDVPVDQIEDRQAINEELFKEQLSQIEALTKQEVALRASAEEQVNQERQARSLVQAEATRVKEALLAVEQRAAREAEQKELLKAQLSAEEEARRVSEEQAKAESSARLTIEVDLLEAKRQKEELQAAIAKEKGKRGALAARRKAEAMALRAAEQRLEAESKVLEELQARLETELETRQALELRSGEEAEARTRVESTLAQERIARQELEDKLQEQLVASNALAATIQGETQALADIESNLAAERAARAGLEAKLIAEASVNEELAAKMQQEVQARQAVEQSLDREREEKQLLRAQLQTEAAAREELAERILAEERARETAQRALEGKRETVLELEEKLRVEAAATAELLARTRSEAETRQALGQQLQEEQEARARLESSPKIDPELQARLDDAVRKNVELQQAVANEAAARVQAEQNLALETDARKAAETRVDAEQQLNASAQAALANEHQARVVAEQKVKTETQMTEVAQQMDAAAGQFIHAESDDIAEDTSAETETARPFSIISTATDVESIADPTPPLLTERLEEQAIPEEAQAEFTGDKSQRAQFVSRLGEQMAAMEEQWESQDLDGFAATLQWVSRYTELFGLSDMLVNANELLEIAETEAFGLVPTKLRYLKRLYARIEGGKAIRVQAAASSSSSPAPDKGGISARTSSSKAGSVKASTSQPEVLVRSSLNVSNPTIRRLVKRSAIRLGELLTAMDSCYRNEDHKELVKLCYRLRGEADIAGLKAFISPARKLEDYAKTGQLNRLENQLVQLRDLLGRIELPESEVTDSHAGAPSSTTEMAQETVELERLSSNLTLTNPKLKVRVQQFVVRLGTQLTEMSELFQQENYEELASISTWVVNYGRVMGFDAISQLAEGLLESVESRNDQEIHNNLDQLRMLFSRIEV